MLDLFLGALKDVNASFESFANLDGLKYFSY